MSMKRIINTEKAPKAVGAYSQAVEANNTLYVSGQLPIVPETGKFAGDDIRSQARQALENTRNILLAAGYAPDDVVKSTILLKNIGDFAAVNEIYAGFYADSLPARAAYEVANLPLGTLIEIETVAAK